jgi:cellulose biosynthesis protein BcsQ
MRYLIWNNKGGVGKTFLTYCLATEYASCRPDKIVVVIDMCPQANVSEMVLGGDGLGEENLEKCYTNGRTVASYIKSRYDKSMFGKIGDEISYFVKAKDYNAAMPENIYLLPGDVDLDICSSLIDHASSSPVRNAWVNSRSYLNDLISVFEGNKKADTVFFIDTNPSFANYTQLGLIAANRLIVPCTADFASMRGIYNIFRLVFDVKFEKTVFDEKFDTFYSKIKDIGISPKIHSFILNKARTINRSASKAYQAHVGNIEHIIKDFAIKYASCFTESKQIERIYTMKDCNTLSPIINYNGLLPSSLQHGHYDVYDVKAQANQGQIDFFLDDLRQIVAGLD